MYQIVICPNNSAANTALSFKLKENFESARKNIHERMKVGVNALVQDDDAGQCVEIPVDNISYCMYIDIDKQQEFAMFAKAASQPPRSDAPKTLEEEMEA